MSTSSSSSSSTFPSGSTLTWVEKTSAAVPSRYVLADRMKSVESSLVGARLDPELHWLVRLDGHGFSKFTRGFVKPCDERIHLAMVRTSVDLLAHFTPASIYTESDEITLVFPARRHYLDQALARPSPPTADALKELQASVDSFVLPYNGKVQKLVSLLAGFTSARFNAHMAALAADAPEEEVRRKASGGFAYFDARVFQLSSAAEVLHNVIWRSQDAVRNSKSMLGHAFLAKHAMHGLSSDEIIHKVYQERGVNYYDFPRWFHGGVLIKKTAVLREMPNKNPKLASPQLVQVMRRTFVSAFWIDLPSATPELLLAKNVSDIPLFEEMFKDIDYQPPKMQ